MGKENEHLFKIQWYGMKNINLNLIEFHQRAHAHAIWHVWVRVT